MTARIEVRGGASPTRRGRPAPSSPPPGPVPLHAALVVVGAWLLFGVLVFMYSMLALLLLPLLPLFLFGPVCLLSWAHGYARDARERGLAARSVRS
jgi:hypothetical protein